MGAVLMMMDRLKLLPVGVKGGGRWGGGRGEGGMRWRWEEGKCGRVEGGGGGGREEKEKID